jgi:ELWxxDGT repeat protein
LFFRAGSDTNGTELWTLEGSTATLLDINPTGSSSPNYLTALGSTLFFAADDGTRGIELWKSDGVTATLVRDINVGAQGSRIGRIFAFGSNVFFDADEGTNGIELWKSDGTTTTLVGDLRPGADSSLPRNFVTVGSNMFFRADDGTNGTELWKSDGVTATLVRDINLSGSSSPARLTVVNTELYWEARQPLVREIWKSDGTSSGTNLVTEIETNSMDDLTMARIGERLFFLTGDKASGGGAVGKLWSLALPSAPSPPSGASTDVPLPVTVLETKTKTSVFSSFLANSSALPVAARKGIKKMIASFEAVNQVICTGYTSGTTSNSNARALARQRAKAACDVAQRLAPAAEVRIKVSPAAGIGSKFRSVRVKITGS